MGPKDQVWTIHEGDDGSATDLTGTKAYQQHSQEYSHAHAHHVQSTAVDVNAAHEMFDFETMSVSTLTSPDNNAHLNQNHHHNNNQNSDSSSGAGHYSLPSTTSTQLKPANGLGFAIDYLNSGYADKPGVYSTTGFESNFDMAFNQTLAQCEFEQPHEQHTFDGEFDFARYTTAATTVTENVMLDGSTTASDYYMSTTTTPGYGMSSDLDLAIHDLDISHGLGSSNGDDADHEGMHSSANYTQFGANGPHIRHARLSRVYMTDYANEIDVDMEVDSDPKGQDTPTVGFGFGSSGDGTYGGNSTGHSTGNGTGNSGEHTGSSGENSSSTAGGGSGNGETPSDSQGSTGTQVDDTEVFARITASQGHRTMATLRQYGSLDAIALSNMHHNDVANERERQHEPEEQELDHKQVYSHPKLYAPRAMKSSSSSNSTQYNDPVKSEDCSHDWNATLSAAQFQRFKENEHYSSEDRRQSQPQLQSLPQPKRQITRQKSFDVRMMSMDMRRSLSPPPPLPHSPNSHRKSASTSTHPGPSRGPSTSTSTSTSNINANSSPTKKKPATNRMLRAVTSMINLSDLPAPVPSKIRERPIQFTNYSTNNMPAKAIQKRPSKKELKKKRSSPLKQMRATEIPIESSSSTSIASLAHLMTNISVHQRESNNNLRNAHHHHHQQSTNTTSTVNPLEVNPFEPPSLSSIQNSPHPLDHVPLELQTSFEFANHHNHHSTDSDPSDMSDHLHQDLHWNLTQETVNWQH